MLAALGKHARAGPEQGRNGPERVPHRGEGLLRRFREAPDAKRIAPAGAGMLASAGPTTPPIFAVSVVAMLKLLASWRAGGAAG